MGGDWFGELDCVVNGASQNTILSVFLKRDAKTHYEGEGAYSVDGMVVQSGLLMEFEMDGEVDVEAELTASTGEQSVAIAFESQNCEWSLLGVVAGTDCGFDLDSNAWEWDGGDVLSFADDECVGELTR